MPVPSHAYLNLSPGLDFETRLFYKQDAARLLEQELAAPSYRCSPITIGANTDPYQPIEREYRVTRSIIEVLAKYRHPFSIITKSAMIERDIDLLAPLAADELVYAMVSVTTLSNELKRTLEPRTASPAARLRAIRKSARGGHSRRRDGCAGHSGAHRCRAGTHSRGGGRMPARVRPAMCCCDCLTS